MKCHFNMKNLIALLIFVTPLQTVAQNLSMDSCKYFAGLVNSERAKHRRKPLEYQESSQLIINKSAQLASVVYRHQNTEYCAETLSGAYTLQRSLASLLASEPHRKILMSKRKKICVGLFKKGAIYYTVVRLYN